MSVFLLYCVCIMVMDGWIVLVVVLQMVVGVSCEVDIYCFLFVGRCGGRKERRGKERGEEGDDVGRGQENIGKVVSLCFESYNLGGFPKTLNKASTSSCDVALV